MIGQKMLAGAIRAGRFTRNSNLGNLRKKGHRGTIPLWLIAKRLKFMIARTFPSRFEKNLWIKIRITFYLASVLFSLHNRVRNLFRECFVVT
jgi:hypothetical protein